MKWWTCFLLATLLGGCVTVPKTDPSVTSVRSDITKAQQSNEQAAHSATVTHSQLETIDYKASRARSFFDDTN